MDTFDEHLILWNTKPKRLGGLLTTSLRRKNKFIKSLDKLVPELLEPSLLPRYVKTITVSCNTWDPVNLWNSKSMQNYLAVHDIDIAIDPKELQQQPPEHLYQWAFDLLFRKSADLQRNIDLVKRDQLRIGQNEPYVGIHMRLGNKSTKWKDPERHSISDTDKFLECGRKMQSILSGNGSRNTTGSATAVNDNSSSTMDGLEGLKSSTPHDTGNLVPILYVASDSNEAKKLVQSKDSTVRTAALEVFHIDRSNAQSRSEAYGGNIAAWTEFMLLAEADCIVASRSGFSEAAVRISLKNENFDRCYAYFYECTTMEDIRNHSPAVIATSTAI